MLRLSPPTPWTRGGGGGGGGKVKRRETRGIDTTRREDFDSARRPAGSIGNRHSSTSTMSKFSDTDRTSSSHSSSEHEEQVKHMARLTSSSQSHKTIHE